MGQQYVSAVTLPSLTKYMFFF